MNAPLDVLVKQTFLNLALANTSKYVSQCSKNISYRRTVFVVTTLK